MGNDIRSSLLPPGAPVPDPPGAKLLAKIPVFVVGLIFLVYLIYNIRLEVVDWRNFPSPQEASVSEITGESPPPPPSLLEILTHPIANDPKRCLECHDLAEETLEILPGAFGGDQVCLACHPLKDFDEQHRGHKFEPFEKCTMCHSPHKSIEKPLMKETYVNTCTICHPFPDEE
ncbi:MAG: cytochrome c3 family protein [Planctomycetaceae bacterium]|nr:cytochrome c3 family protein [Planctomycetaceae bacterium]